MKKPFLFWLVLATILVTASWVIYSQDSPKKRGMTSAEDQAVRSAVALYKRRISEGMNMSSGPCLTNDLMPGWVVDIVNSPRAQSDDWQENQCAAFREGRAKHLVELDLSGNLVQVK